MNEHFLWEKAKKYQIRKKIRKILNEKVTAHTYCRLVGSSEH